jgi:DNA polymerase-3 subunit beta
VHPTAITIAIIYYMKLIVIKGNIKDAISVVEHTTGEQQNLPILKNIFISAGDNKIKLITTNLEIAVTSVVPGKIIEAGATTVSAGLFSNIIANLQTERINIEQKEKTLEIQTDNYEAKIQVLPKEDFPIIPKIKNEEHFLEIPGDILRTALTQVVPSAQATDLRPELNSVLFSFSLDHLKIVATDSFRLAEKTISKNQIATAHKEAFKIIVPLKTTQELSRIIKTNDPVRIYHDENQVLFSTNTFELISRLNEGAFPDYEYLIPKKHETEVAVSREEFLNALRLVGVFSARVHEVRLKTDANKKHITISSEDQTLGENKYLLPAKIDGAGKDVSFNWRYLSDGLRVIPGEQIVFGMNEDNKPTIIRSPIDASYFYILMPILKV